MLRSIANGLKTLDRARPWAELRICFARSPAGWSSSARLDNGSSFRLPLTQQNVADACGLSVVHVNRTLQELRRQGLIEWRNHIVQLRNRTALEDMAGFNRDYLHALELARSPIMSVTATMPAAAARHQQIRPQTSRDQSD